MFIPSFRYHVLNTLVVLSIAMKSKHTLVQSSYTINLLLGKLFNLIECQCLYLGNGNKKSFFQVTVIVITMTLFHLLICVTPKGD